MTDQYWTETEIGRIFKLSRSTMNRLRSEENLPHHKIGRTIRYRFDEIEQWLEKNREHNPEKENE